MHPVEGNGQFAIIEDWLVIAASQTMCNLTVQQDHTYTVGDGQFVVHNCGDVRTPAQAAADLQYGSTETRVATREDAETVFRKQYLGQNLRNTTGLSDMEVKDLFKTTEGTYHWDEEVDESGRLLSHAEDNPHAYSPHLQIHPVGGPTIRIFFGG